MEDTTPSPAGPRAVLTLVATTERPTDKVMGQARAARR